MKLLIDADSAIYKAGLSNETRKYVAMDEDGGTLAEFRYKKDIEAWVTTQEKPESILVARSREVGPLGYSIGNLKRLCNKMIAPPFPEGTEITYQMYIQGEDNFRHDIYPDYKANRTSADKPVHTEEMLAYLRDVWGAITVDFEETDDRVSYLHYMAPKETTCIVTIDKDLKNTPGWNYNYDKEELHYVTEKEAELHFARQLLKGDKGDNIPNLPRVGDKTAEKILPEWRADWLDVVKAEYIKHYPEDTEFLHLNMNGSLLWMRRLPEEIWDYRYKFIRGVK